MRKERTATDAALAASLFRAMLLSCVIMGLYFLLLYKNFSFVYDINDDVAMRNAAAGVITGEPDAHLIHIKYIMGLWISTLYSLLPGLDWYGLTMIGVILFSFSVILYRGLASKRSLVWKTGYTVLALLLFTCIGVQHVTAFQWTVTAAVAGASGIFLFCTADSGGGFQCAVEEGMAVFLVLLALLIRDDVFLMALPLAGLCFCEKYVSLTGQGRVPLLIRRAGVPLGLLGGVLLILGVEAWAYRAPEWKEFLSYNKDREAIMDYYGLADYEEDREFYDSLGMTAEEVENLQRYSLYLTDGLYSEKMAALAERSRERYQELNPPLKRLAEAAEGIYENWTKDTYHGTNLICLAVAAAVLGLSYKKGGRQWWLALSVLAATGLYWLYLGYRHRILERVGFALYFLTIFILAALWYRLMMERQEAGSCFWMRLQASAAWAVACLALFLTAFNVWQDIRENNAWRSHYNLEFLAVNDYMAEHMENVYYMTTFSIETYTDNFTVFRDFSFSNLLSVGGWHTFSPLENGKCHALGIADSKTDIVEKNNVYVISLSNVNLRYMDRYYTALYGNSYLGYELVDTLDYGERVFEVYDFSARVQ